MNEEDKTPNSLSSHSGISGLYNFTRSLQVE